MRKLKVIIADDINVIAESNKKIVTKNDQIEVVGIANDGQQEYDMIFELKPDIVITDNQMPKLNGIEVIEKINNSDLAYIPKFILITGDSDRTLYNKCSELGVIGVINKPVREDTLLYTIEEIIDIIKSETPEM